MKLIPRKVVVKIAYKASQENDTGLTDYCVFGPTPAPRTNEETLVHHTDSFPRAERNERPTQPEYFWGVCLGSLNCNFGVGLFKLAC